VIYWLWFFLLLPWMLVRQAFLSAYDLVGALFTWNRRITFLGGALEIQHMSSLGGLLATTLFGERFACTRYGDVLIDPGPRFGRSVLARWISAAPPIRAIVATHSHEEHIGNVDLAASLTDAPILGSTATLEAIASPEIISVPRQLLMGQPAPQPLADRRHLSDELSTQATRLRVLPSDGHCKGHASLYDPERRILFAGDSFLQTIFTAPNRDVSGDDWIATLRLYQSLDIATLIGSHGCIFSTDPSIPTLPFVVRRRSPNEMIARKLEFTLWAAGAVADGEHRGLPYSVIEACLFPWQRPWSWGNWFVDESWRLFSAGEFSRTHFVRSLSKTPQAVPHRFPGFEGLRARVGAAIERRKELLRIHLLALHPMNVLGILLGIVLSLAPLGLCARNAQPELSWPRALVALPALVADHCWSEIALLFVWWVAVWATLGGAVTRKMALAIKKARPERFSKSFLFCCRPALAMPSALASLCFVFILLAQSSLLFLIPVLPVWLYAGFVYGPLVTDRVGLKAAVASAHARIRNFRRLVELQLRFLSSFSVTTGAIYLAALLGSLALASILGRARAIFPIVFLFGYALGYTTANLKSLQLFLFLQLGETKR
jgi:glyoxylase-like metal-dependent hydrolase (beta-lactamase superfamily II)